ncbi:hypothetical protein Tco_1045337 [Tanacetum coccineum]|uniref:Reverse transcriptase domain-containing protein n=1 Tax=Tanacetum coccineum TaxID=301880 RepID=A0ABQ5GUD8_9ASTR
MDSKEVKSKKETEESSKGIKDELKSDKSKKADSSEEKAKVSRKKMLGRKRAGKEQQQESSKKQRMEDDKETYEVEEVEEVDEGELKKNLVIVKDDDIGFVVFHLLPQTTSEVDASLLKKEFYVILIGSISVEVPVAPEVGATTVASPVGVLELDIHSSSEADPSESSPPLVFVAHMVSPFLCSDDSESDTEILERHVSPTHHDALLTRWRSRVALRSSSPTTSTQRSLLLLFLPAPSAIVFAPSSEFPVAPVVAPPRIRRRRAIPIRPEEEIPIGRLYRTHPGRPCRALTARKSVRPLPSHHLALRYTSHQLGTMLLPVHHRVIIFRSFISWAFITGTFLINNLIFYDIELRRRSDVRVMYFCTLLDVTRYLRRHPFNIDLMPIEIGSFDVIIDMDWLANHHAVIVYDEKIVRIPYGDEVLIVQGDRGGKGEKSKFSIISCTKTQKYIKRGCCPISTSRWLRLSQRSSKKSKAGFV